jgi:hypothetical protein
LPIDCDRHSPLSRQAEVRVLGANLKWKLVSQLVGSCLVLMLAIGMTSCDKSSVTTTDSSTIAAGNGKLATTDGPLSEVNTPDSIAKLAPTLEKYQPQVQILSPKADEVLSDDRVTVKLKVNDLPLFKQPELGLGNHLHVILDKQTYQGIYDLTQPLVFKNLTAGTHSLRVFASRPWHESFKNEGAYAQTTFHVLTKTAENNPNPQQPLLTYSRPTGTYSSEPIMLDYYLSNAPSHLVAKGSDSSLPDWRIRVTVNGQQFILDRWAPIYLQGFKLGKNWVKLELVDDRGNPMPNVYNDTVSIVTYDPQTKDTLAKLIRGELNPNLAMSLVDPNYSAPLPTPSAIESTPIATPAPMITPPIEIEPIPSPIVNPSPPIIEPTLAPVQSPLTIAIAQPQPLPSPTPTPVIISPKPILIPQPTPVAMPAPVAVNPRPQPIETPTPQPIAIPNPIVVSEPKPESIIKPVSPPISTAPDSLNPVKSAPVAKIEEENNWQTQAVELFKTAGVKTREFTNSIPPKVERFGNNIQTWIGNAIDTSLAKVQAWRDSANSDRKPADNKTI